MKRILFLDDDKTRHEIFGARDHGKAVIDHVNDVLACIKALRENPPYDLVSLDHDLDSSYVFETGVAVAEFINLHLEPEKYPREVVIHSWNPPGARRMFDLIAAVGMPVTLAPFAV